MTCVFSGQLQANAYCDSPDIVLIGTKADRRDLRDVHVRQARDLADRYGWGPETLLMSMARYVLWIFSYAWRLPYHCPFPPKPLSIYVFIYVSNYVICNFLKPYLKVRQQSGITLNNVDKFSSIRIGSQNCWTKTKIRHETEMVSNNVNRVENYCFTINTTTCHLFW